MIPYFNRHFSLMVGATVILVAAVFAGACGDDDDDGGDEDEGLTKVAMTMGWLANGTFAPAFLADDLGYFEEEGLDVEIRQGGPAGGVALLDGGQFDFMVASVDDVPLGIVDGLDVKAIAVLAHKSPAAVVVKDESIQTPEDLEGKTVAATEGDVQNLLFPNFLEAVGLDPSAVEVTLVDGDIRTSLLLTGQVDAAQMFLTDDWLSARAEDPSLRAFGYSEYGVDHITTGILARNDLLEQQPEVARGFVRAILRAYAYAAANPDDAVQAAADVYPENFESAETGAEQVVEFTKLMVTPETEENGLGYSTPEEWESFVDILVEQGALEEGDVRPVEEYFTNEFLPKEPVVMES